MGNSNEMTIIFDSRPENEGLARVAAAAFCTQLNPTLEEVADLKTAVSEACLLYTSPSPRDISGSRMPSSA